MTKNAETREWAPCHKRTFHKIWKKKTIESADSFDVLLDTLK